MVALQTSPANCKYEKFYALLIVNMRNFTAAKDLISVD